MRTSIRPPAARGAPRALLAVTVLLAVTLGCHADAPSAVGARPDLNERFRGEDVDVEQYVDLFESESREIAACRPAIAATLQLRPGMAVADVGTGTGLYLQPLAEAVGAQGTVWAVDISEAFVEHVRARAAAEGWSQVRPVLCSDDSVELPPESVDVAFVCDTYHHFEHPQATLASIRRALRPGGRLVVVDFVREPGSREWVLDHVRAGEEQTRAEIEAAGFRFEDRPDVPGLTENYVLRFRR